MTATPRGTRIATAPSPRRVRLTHVMEAAPSAVAQPQRVGRPVAVPWAPRIRRVTRVTRRPVGTMSLFLAATVILGLTSLFYLWQSAERTKAAYYIPQLTTELSDEMIKTNYLKIQIDRLRAPGAVIEAAKNYGMLLHGPNVVREVDVPSQDVRRVIVVPTAPRQATATVRLSTTDVTMTSWWQDLWVSLYNVLH